MSVKWLQQLEDSQPNLALIAMELNKVDGFVMYKKGERQQQGKERKKKKKPRKEHGHYRNFSTECTTPPPRLTPSSG